ncbi:MAG: UDP-2,3-diacylglucosamine diphosphatase [Inhella sp.]
MSLLIDQIQAPPAWRRLAFISDLHLGPDTPRTLLALQRALQALDADALFILGDLFEAWVGDDARELPWAQAVVALLSTCAATRPVYFQHGNRDFLLGTAMAEACSLQLLADDVCLQAFGQRVVLVHGDAECLEDRPYQAFRAQVRQPAWQQGFLAQPLATSATGGAGARRQPAGPGGQALCPTWTPTPAPPCCSAMAPRPRFMATPIARPGTHCPAAPNAWC